MVRSSSYLAGCQSSFHETYGDYRTERFMERGPTLYQHQNFLPRLPVPSLEETFARYMQTVQPLTTEAEYQRTIAAAREFLQPGGLGETLQARLIRRSKDRHDSSWLAEWWNKSAYLYDRGPTVFFVSYYYHFSDGPRAVECSTQMGRAAALLHAALEFRQYVIAGTLPPEKIGRRGTPLCSVAYKYMFNACRVPGDTADRVRLYPPAANNHVLVVRHNRFFIIYAADNEGKPLPMRDIQSQLQAVIDLAGPRETEARPVGVLTSWGRSEWARARDQLVADGNAELLERAEAAALVICLDDDAPMTKSEVARALWHGDGRNRHFDKSVQIVVFSNGKAGLVGEHSMMDGMPATSSVIGQAFLLHVSGKTVRLTDFMMKKTMGFSEDTVDDAASPVGLVAPPRPLDLALSPRSLRAISTAEAAFDQLVRDHEMEVFDFHGYGVDEIKRFKISPDAFVQMALQLGVFKMTGEFWATYESVQVRKFLHGRTTCARSLSSAAKDWVLAMEADGDRRPTVHRLELLRKAAESHVEYVRNASEGKDVDRHLLGLSKVLNDGESSPVFDDPVFSRSKHWRVSTSHLTHEMLESWGFGEVVADGVGVAYSIHKRSMVFTIASLHRPESWPARLSYCVREALLEMRALCEHSYVRELVPKL